MKSFSLRSVESKNSVPRTFRLSLILIDSFIWLVHRVEPMEQAKLVAIAGGPATFTVLPADDLKNRAKRCCSAVSRFLVKSELVFSHDSIIYF